MINDLDPTVTTFAKLYLLPLVYLAAAILVEHMAFRSPGWQRRELVRRAVGVVTVLAATFLPVAAGALAFHTWLYIAVAFGVAGLVKVGAAAYERGKALDIRGTFNEYWNGIANETPRAD